MIGIDILEIERIKNIANDAFSQRVFTENERQYLAEKNFHPQTIAGMFCAKEAVLKALGCGLGSGGGFLQIEISHSDLGQPTVTLSGNCKDMLKNLGSQIFISISHTVTIATAIAMIK